MVSLSFSLPSVVQIFGFWVQAGGGMLRHSPRSVQVINPAARKFVGHPSPDLNNRRIEGRNGPAGRIHALSSLYLGA